MGFHCVLFLPGETVGPHLIPGFGSTSVYTFSHVVDLLQLCILVMISS